MRLFNSKRRVGVTGQYYCENCSDILEEKIYSLELFDKNCGSFYPYRYLCSPCFKELSTKNVVIPFAHDI